MTIRNQILFFGLAFACLAGGLMAVLATDNADKRSPWATRISPGSQKVITSSAASLRATASAEMDDNKSTLTLPAYPQFAQIGVWNASSSANGSKVQLCQAVYPSLGSPSARRPLCGVQCDQGCCCDGREPTWKHSQEKLPFDLYGPGEYVGAARTPHVAEYRIRVDDEVGFVYILSRKNLNGQYKLEIGDRITIESVTDAKLNRHHLNSGSQSTSDQGQGILVQPDGNITLPLLGQVKASGRSVMELAADLEQRYKEFYKVPGITVTPLKVNTRLYDFRDAVDQRFGDGGLGTQSRVSPDGTVQLPAIGSVPAQGLTLNELESEVNARYAGEVQGINVTVTLVNRAPRFVYVLGEVETPGRYELNGPTTVMQSVALAGGWNNGGNLRQIVIFRRGCDWRLLATKLDLRGAMIGKRPCPADELWVRDCDIVLVPKSSLLVTADFIDLVFTRGIYGVMPFSGITINFAKLSSL